LQPESETKEFAKPCSTNEDLKIENFDIANYNLTKENDREKIFSNFNNLPPNERLKAPLSKNFKPNQNSGKIEINNVSVHFKEIEKEISSVEDEDFAENNDHYENKIHPTSVKNLKQQKSITHQNFMSQKNLLPPNCNYHHTEDNELFLESKTKALNKKNRKKERSKNREVYFFF
jgi:hypothetical protein